MSTSERYSDQLVQRVNELYHDLDHDSYDTTHPEIFELERHRWLRLAGAHLDRSKPLEIVDIGTGTGFVPLTVGALLGAEDRFCCTDVSQGMLDSARASLESHPPTCQLRYLKLEIQVPMRLPFADASVDVVTMNSVLHHIKDTENFLAEVSRILRPNGLFFIAHEPNAYFQQNRFLKGNAAIATRLLDPKVIAFELLRALGISEMAKSVYYRLRPEQAKRISRLEEITAQVNKVLLEEELIRHPLDVLEIGHITDIALDGFKPDRLLPNFETVACETYHHLATASIDTRGRKIFQRYEAWLREHYPMGGRDFFVILRKPR